MLMVTFIMTGYRRSGYFAEKILLLRYKEGIKEGAKSKNSRGVIKKKGIEGVKLWNPHFTSLYFTFITLYFSSISLVIKPIPHLFPNISMAISLSGFLRFTFGFLPCTFSTRS
jgi:hypothetical protein